MRCPLCDGARFEASWLGAVLHEGVEFEFVECSGCRSSLLHPMPDDDTVSRLYGPGYAAQGEPGGGIDDPKQPQKVVSWLGRLEARS